MKLREFKALFILPGQIGIKMDFNRFRECKSLIETMNKEAAWLSLPKTSRDSSKSLLRYKVPRSLW